MRGDLTSSRGQRSSRVRPGAGCPSRRCAAASAESRGRRRREARVNRVSTPRRRSSSRRCSRNSASWSQHPSSARNVSGSQFGRLTMLSSSSVRPATVVAGGCRPPPHRSPDSAPRRPAPPVRYPGSRESRCRGCRAPPADPRCAGSKPSYSRIQALMPRARPGRPPRDRRQRRRGPRAVPPGRHRQRSTKPPCRPASTPEIASSTTAAWAGSTPRRRAASRKSAGSGLPASPSSAASRPSTFTSKSSRIPAASSTATQLRLDETIAVRTPRARSLAISWRVVG